MRPRGVPARPGRPGRGSSLRLITAHRILIGAAIAFFVFFAAVQVRLYVRAPAVAPLVEAVVSAAVAAGLAVYYRTLSGK